MRLTKLKLAGFKSFVDPTTIELPGQLVGVVGPNGCGKSNVMDAVRWVLGESRASELRGESMQDVIFNGSSQRKPVSRASVEMIFDNSLGRASGQWSQFAELSVKRVLTRNGQSDYFINNLRVRRKDVTDLFLGTGLGPRAYAIIGQGMISRIIEAKPEELRVFLEEAAGVTRYKERRKETEGRLSDTRENLARVEDIRQELGVQMERLEAQAEVARHYQELNVELTRKQQLLWLIRRDEARAEQQRLALEIDRASTELEGQTAALRELELRLEQARELHFSSSDGVHQAQGEYFSTNAEVARLEAEIKHQKDTRRQLESRLGQLAGELSHWQEQAERVEEDEARWRELEELSDLRVEQAAMKQEMQQERLPLAEEAQAAALEAVQQERLAIAEVEQRLQVEQNNRTHAIRSLQTLAQRRERAEAELAALSPPENAELDEKQEELALLREELAMAREQMADAQARVPELEGGRREALARLQRAQKDNAEAQARRSALEQLQKRVQSQGKVGDWLRQQGLAGRPPLWQLLQVAPGWETALESVLRERLGALLLQEADLGALEGWLSTPPGGKLALLWPGVDPMTGGAAGAMVADALLDRVSVSPGSGEAGLREVLATWLAGVATTESLGAALARREHLAPGEILVTREGHQVSRHGVNLFAPDSAEHGLMERQREIDELAVQLEARQAEVAAAQSALTDLEQGLAAAQSALAQARSRSNELQGREHQAQMEILRLSQALERFRERQTRLQESLGELAQEAEFEQTRQVEAEDAIADLREEISRRQGVLIQVRSRQDEADRRLRDEREALAGSERELREAQFSQRECRSKLAEIDAHRQTSVRQLSRLQEEEAQCKTQYETLGEDPLEPRLQAALDLKAEREQLLAAARDRLEEAAQQLRDLEEQRMRIEQGHLPLRDRIADLRLKEQAASLNVEQYGGQLLEAEADEAALQAEVGGARPAALQSAIGHLQKAILELGAVNLAALQELESARERKGYLDMQSEDLTLAMETLENAIRRIDKETRDLLQSTFDTVNSHFGTLFPTLFGGGEARLIMTGEEILDAGVQVMAQPPGKKNSTIHLLSGGEKALTAIALVFAMFQLNPAPFCLLDEVDAPLDDSNTERFADMVRRMSVQTQFLFISHNKIAMEMAEQLVGVTMQESGVSRIVEVDMEQALRMREAA